MWKGILAREPPSCHTTLNSTNGQLYWFINLATQVHKVSGVIDWPIWGDILCWFVYEQVDNANFSGLSNPHILSYVKYMPMWYCHIFCKSSISLFTFSKLNPYQYVWIFVQFSNVLTLFGKFMKLCVTHLEIWKLQLLLYEG